VDVKQPLDVSPRPSFDDRAAGRARRRRNWRAYGLGLVVLLALGFVVFRGLGNATVFFYNVDEAVARRPSLGEKRFRIQGTVEATTISRTAQGATFAIVYNGVEAPVRHQGDLPQLFQPQIPVVLEGHWQGNLFESDRMLVKHSEVYTAKNPDRVKSYDEMPGGSSPVSSTTVVP
jgi:cytochrome c-type biogenesis protein CcmE